MQIVTRAEWGARPPLRTPYRPPSPATEVYLHHTAGSHAGAAGMRSMQIYHQSADPSRNKSAWNDIAYNFVIDPHDLKVYEGRGWGVAPGAQQGHNVGTQAICVMGDFRSRRPTQGLLDVIANLIRTGYELGHIPLVLTGGHRDAPNQSTTCPGQNLHREIPNIRNLLEDDMPTIEELEQMTRRGVKEETGPAVMAAWVYDPDGVAPGEQGNPFPRPALHFNTVFRKIRADLTATKTRVFALAAVAGASATQIVNEIANRLGG